MRKRQNNQGDLYYSVGLLLFGQRAGHPDHGPPVEETCKRRGEERNGGRVCVGVGLV